jgi:dihydrofolate reductase
MRNVVLAMMTTLDGRLDDPGAWVTGISDDQYAEIDRRYEEFDTVLVGSTTYAEMFAYWPGALTDDEGFAGSNAASNLSMARKMNAYKKYVFSKRAQPEPLEWENAELVSIRDDHDLVAFVTDLRSGPGGDLHLAGGASLAQTFARLGLIDEYRFYVYPVVSAGARWFDMLDTPPDLELRDATRYDNGVVGLYYRTVGSSS